MYVILKLEDAKMLAELAATQCKHPLFDKVQQCSGFKLGSYDVSEEIGQNYTHFLNAQTIANNNAVIITNYLFNLL